MFTHDSLSWQNLSFKFEPHWVTIFTRGACTLEAHARRTMNNDDIYDIQGFFESISSCDTQTFFDSISDRIKNFNPKTATCRILECDRTTLTFGFRGGEKILCNAHKNSLEGGVIRLRKHCRFKGCVTSGTIGIGKYKFCSEHVKHVKKLGLPKKSTITKAWKPKCRHEGCNVTPSFDRKTKCREHSVSFSNRNRVCRVPECGGRHPRFGLEGGEAIYCRYHGLERGMVDLYGEFCVYDGCKTRASFKKHKYAQAKYCEIHSPYNYGLFISVCEHQDCVSHPSFGTSDCEKHNPGDHVRKKSHGSKCMHTGCNISATFGFEGKKRSWCFEHKKDGSINLPKHRRVIQEDIDIMN